MTTEAVKATRARITVEQADRLAQERHPYPLPSDDPVETGELHEFTPDWTLHPGVLLRRLMDERKIGPATLALRAGMELPDLRRVLNGTARIDNVTAGRLGGVLGTGTSFWLDAQAGYDADIARGAKDTSREHDDD